MTGNEDHQFYRETLCSSGHRNTNCAPSTYDSQDRLQMDRIRGNRANLFYPASTPAESVADLVNEYCSSKVFLNTSTVSPIPTTLLEAMSCGSAVVSTATCMIPEIIEILGGNWKIK